MPITKTVTTTVTTTVINDEPARDILALVLDRSGSMITQWNDVVAGVTKLLDEQKAQPDLRFTCAVFDDRYVVVADNVPLASVDSSLIKNYPPRGNTALLDAVGRTVRRIEEAAPTGKVLFVVYTDGYENASQEWTKARVRELLTKKREAGWGVLFLGAEEAAWTAESLGAGVGVSHRYGTSLKTMYAVSQTSSGYFAGTIQAQGLAASVAGYDPQTMMLTDANPNP